MLSPPPVERIALPTPVSATPRPPFPWIATAAPLLVAIVLWLVTGSVFSLLFALLGPVVAIGGLIDGLRSRRNGARRERERVQEASDGVRRRIGDAHERERQRLHSLAAAGWDAEGPPVVCWGIGDAPPVVELTGEVESFPELVDLASQVRDAPLIVQTPPGITVTGPAVLARAIARRIALQVAGRSAPATSALTAPAEEAWVSALPHETRFHERPVFAWDLGGGETIELGWEPGGGGSVIGAERGLAASAEEAEVSARALALLAAERGLHRRGDDIPDELELARLLEATAGPGLSAVVGAGAEGPVALDLVADGPHALVAGTTGSGKSELLVTWVVSMAHRRSPAEVTFLLIDFKGGAAFGPLAGLPHVTGIVSDLDPRTTRRAVESLRAEVLRRERLLADHAARSIEDLPRGVLARLVIVVDEFAALLAQGPELHETFGDLAARGRSLGLHLILCTQRPSGVIRDSVLANIGLRISLRVSDPADSVAVLGDAGAARIPTARRGRAILGRDEGARSLQVALTTPGDVEGVVAATERVAAPRPWLDPLPRTIELDELPGAERGLAFGLTDLPAEQRQPIAVYDPSADGHLLVLGSAGAGATTLATTLGESARRAGLPVHVLSADPADAWAQLAAGPGDGLLIADDLDALLARLDPDYRHEFASRLATLLRDPSSHGPRAVVTVRRLSGDLSSLSGLFGSRLLLRQATRDDHLLAGGAHDGWDPASPPGNGWWRGMPVQVAECTAATMPAPLVPSPVEVEPASHPVLAIVAARPRNLVEPLRASGVRLLQLGRDAVGDPRDLHVSRGQVTTVLLGDPDAWQADWSLLTTARREWPMVVIGCTAGDHRALLRDRELPPLLGPDPGECWLAQDGRTVRALLKMRSAEASARDSEAESPENR